MAMTPEQQKAWDAQQEVLRAMDVQRGEKAANAADQANKDSAADKEEATENEITQWKKFDEMAEHLMKPGVMQSFEMCMRQLQDMCLQLALSLNATYHRKFGYPLNPELALAKAAVGLTAGAVGLAKDVAWAGIKAPFQAVYHTADFLWRPSEKTGEARDAASEAADAMYKRVGGKWLHDKVMGESVELSHEMMTKSSCVGGKLNFESVKDLCVGASPEAAAAIDKLVEETQKTFLVQEGYAENPADGKWTHTSNGQQLTQTMFDALKASDNFATSAKAVNVKLTHKAVSFDDTPSPSPRPR